MGVFTLAAGEAPAAQRGRLVCLTWGSGAGAGPRRRLWRTLLRWPRDGAQWLRTTWVSK